MGPVARGVLIRVAITAAIASAVVAAYHLFGPGGLGATLGPGIVCLMLNWATVPGSAVRATEPIPPSIARPAPPAFQYPTDFAAGYARCRDDAAKELDDHAATMHRKHGTDPEGAVCATVLREAATIVRKLAAPTGGPYREAPPPPHATMTIERADGTRETWRRMS